MVLFSVFSQAFSVISEEDNQRVVVEFVVLEVVNDLSYVLGGVSDLSVVGALAVLAIVRRRRFVWIVRVEQVQPQKKRLLVVFLEPVQSLTNHNVAPAFGNRLPVTVQREGKVVVIGIESLVQPPARFEHGGSYDGSRPVAS